MTRYLLLLSTLLLSCQRAQEPGQYDANVLAVFAGGQVTFEDLDREILAQPPDKRQPPQTEQQAWYEGHLRKIAADHLFLEQALAANAHKTLAFQQKKRQIERAYYSAKLLNTSATKPNIQDSQLQEYYDRHIKRFKGKAKRRVAHIFKRWSQERGREAILAEMDGLYQRLVAGEPIEILAAKYSDSETRHKGGSLGFIERGQYPAAFEEIVFSLDKGVVSEPVKSKQGVHIFLVQSVVDAFHLRLEDVKPFIFKQVLLEQQIRLKQELAEKQDQPVPLEVISEEALMQALAQPNGTQIILQVGDFQLSSADFAELLQERSQQMGPSVPPNLAQLMLTDILNSEILYQSRVLPETPERVLQHMLDQRLITHFVETKLADYVLKENSRLRAYYDHHRVRFTTPVRNHLKRMTVALSDQPVAQFAQLEDLYLRVNQNATPLEQEINKVNGKLEDLGFLTMAQLARIEPRAPEFVANLQPNQVSPPYRFGDALVMLQLIARQQPKVLPLANVLDRVVADYLTHHGQQVYKEMTDEMLKAHDYQVIKTPVS